MLWILQQHGGMLWLSVSQYWPCCYFLNIHTPGVFTHFCYPPCTGRTWNCNSWDTAGGRSYCSYGKTRLCVAWNFVFAAKYFCPYNLMTGRFHSRFRQGKTCWSAQALVHTYAVQFRHFEWVANDIWLLMVVVHFDANSRFVLLEKQSETDALFRKFLTAVFAGRH